MSDPQPPEDLPVRRMLPAQGVAPAEPSQESDPPEQRPSGRHAPRSTSGENEPAFGFAPPSSPGFGNPAANDGSRPAPSHYPMSAQQHFGQQPPQLQGGQPQYGYQYAQQAQQFPQPGGPGTANPQDDTYGNPAADHMAQVPRGTSPASRRATTALVLGVIGVIGGIFFGWTLPLSVVAIVLGFLARSKEPHARGTALAAIVTGFVGLVLSVGWLAYSILTWLALTAS